MNAPSDVGWRRTNLGHLLFAATGKCIAAKLGVVHLAGFARVTDAQLALFRHLDRDGTRLTTLAARAGLAKQSMIELVDKAERERLVERRPDPNDRRAKIVVPSPRGMKLRRAAERGAAGAERAFRAAVGEVHVAGIRRALSVLAPGITHTSGAERMLALAAEQFVRDVLGAVHAHGYREVTEASLALFRTLELDGSRLTEVAAAARITKQSMRVLVGRAEAMGLVGTAPDPADGRARTIRFSAAGLVMLDEMRRGVVAAEARLAASVGDTAITDLKARLGSYLATP